MSDTLIYTEEMHKNARRRAKLAAKIVEILDGESTHGCTSTLASVCLLLCIPMRESTVNEIRQMPDWDSDGEPIV